VNQEAFPLLSDFGAANFYDRKDIQVSKAIERMEVRAFGCLIDDLISRIDVEEQTTTQNALNRLKTSCMQESVQERPTLSEVIEELNRL
jgi:hypothetical protein